MPDFTDYSGRVTLPVQRFETPPSLPDLRAALLSAERERPPLQVTAQGTGWSMSLPAYNSGVMVRPHHLTGFPGWLQDAVRQPDNPRRRRLAVESGIRIRDLYLTLLGRPREQGHAAPPAALLAGRRWAMPTLGGAGAQTLAGVVNTGTHGGDVARGPISNYIDAVVLVGSRGMVRVVQRPHPDGCVDVPRLNTHARHAGWDFELRDETAPGALDAVTVAVGRIGVVYAYVISLHDETETVHVQRRRAIGWSELSAHIRDGSIIRDARARDQYLGFSLSPIRMQGEDRPCRLTVSAPVPAQPPAPGTGFADMSPAEPAGRTPFTGFQATDDRSVPVLDARSDLLFETIGQIFSVDSVTPAVQTIRAVLYTTAGLVLATGAAAGGFLGSLVPGAQLVALLVVAAPIAAALTRLADALGRLSAHYVLGDAVAEVLDRARDQVSAAIAVQLMRELVAQAQPVTTPARPGRPEQAWLVHGPREFVADFYNYRLRRDIYRGQSIELFLPVDDGTVPTIESIFAEFDALTRSGLPPAGYVAGRFLAGSAAPLATVHGAPDDFNAITLTLECAFLGGMSAGDTALDRIRQIALDARGRVHWGQLNELDAAETAATVPRVGEWKTHLQRLEGDSTTFLNDFSLRHGLAVQPAGNPWAPWGGVGITAESSANPTAVGGRGRPIDVLTVGADGTVRVGRRTGGGPTLIGATRAGQLDPVTPIGAVHRSDDHRLEFVARRLDGRVVGSFEEGPAVSLRFADWHPKGGDNDKIDQQFLLLRMRDAAFVEVLAPEFGARRRLRRVGSGFAGSWGGMSDVGGEPVGAFADAVTRSRRAGTDAVDPHLLIVAAAAPPESLLRWRRLDGPASDTWIPLPGLPAGQPAAVSITDDGSRVRLLVLTTAGRLYEAVDEAPGGDVPQFSCTHPPGWAELPIPRLSLRGTGGLAVVHSAATTTVFAVGGNGAVQTISSDGRRWTEWTDLAGAVVGRVAAAPLPDGRLEVYARGPGDNIMVRTQHTPGSW